jgi:hypothetical protein
MPLVFSMSVKSELVSMTTASNTPMIAHHNAAQARQS